MNGFLDSKRPNIWLHAASRSSRFASALTAATTAVWRRLGCLLATADVVLRTRGVGFAFVVLPGIDQSLVVSAVVGDQPQLAGFRSAFSRPAARSPMMTGSKLSPVLSASMKLASASSPPGIKVSGLSCWRQPTSRQS